METLTRDQAIKILKDAQGNTEKLGELASLIESQGNAIKGLKAAIKKLRPKSTAKDDDDLFSSIFKVDGEF